MPTSYRLSQRALRELRSICNYIGVDSVESAIRVESEILDACELLASSPFLGSVRIGTTKLPVRFWPVSRYPNYLIVYRPGVQPIQIVAIIHGRRDMKKILK